MPVSDDIKKQHRKIKKKGFKAMVGYFWDYYKVPTAVVLAVLIMLVLLIRDVANSKPYGFYAMMINPTFAPDSTAISDDFAAYVQMDTAQLECYIDTTTTMSTSTTNFNQYDVAARERVMAITASGDLDVMVADPSVFDSYAGIGYMADLRTVMDEDQLSAYEGQIYYVDQVVVDARNDGTYEEPVTDTNNAAASDKSDMADESVSGSSDSATANKVDAAEAAATMDPNQEAMDLMGLSHPTTITPSEDFVMPDPSTMKEPVPVGIILTDTAYMTSSNAYAGTVPIYGILANTKRPELALSFLNYLSTTQSQQSE